MIRGVVLVVLAVGGLAGLAVWRVEATRDAERRAAAAETSRLRAWARSETAAGISVVPKRVPEVRRADLDRLEELPGFHEFAMRCSSCHVLPDPAAYTGRQWIGRVDVMRRHIDRSGVLPPPDSELVAVRGFLEEASRILRP